MWSEWMKSVRYDAACLLTVYYLTVVNTVCLLSCRKDVDIGYGLFSRIAEFTGVLIDHDVAEQPRQAKI